MSKDEFSRRWAEYSELVSVTPTKDLLECLQTHMSWDVFSQIVSVKSMKDLLEVLEIRTVDLPSLKQPEQEALSLPAGVSPLQLMKNKVDCYRVIIVLRMGGPTTRDILWVTLHHVQKLANSEWGTWLLQDFFNVFHWNDPAMVALVNKLKPHTAEFLLSKHAHSVLKKMVLTLPPGMLDFIIETIESEGAVKLAKDQYASRVVQRVVKLFVKFGMEDRLANVLDRITCAAPELSKEEFGNYIIQAILIFCSNRHRSTIVQNLRGHWTQLASRFFVVEALLDNSHRMPSRVKKELRQERMAAIGSLNVVELVLLCMAGHLPTPEEWPTGCGEAEGKVRTPLRRPAAAPSEFSTPLSETDTTCPASETGSESGSATPASLAAAPGPQDRDDIATELSNLEVDAVAEFDRRAAEIFTAGSAPDMSGDICGRLLEWRRSMGLVRGCEMPPQAGDAGATPRELHARQ